MYSWALSVIVCLPSVSGVDGWGPRGDSQLLQVMYSWTLSVIVCLPSVSGVDGWGPRGDSHLSQFMYSGALSVFLPSVFVSTVTVERLPWAGYLGPVCCFL